ncbi:adenine deaminase [Conoideocrella luteorostrata]|uniref:Adenine deaminase n=1 Tax=Conoideocrella luteorostrata TaxID=1105319 RepID=A0AAJ0CN12_9HYPO|nr:adenine deaminase [Conoideocrella luteorostrata]
MCQSKLHELLTALPKVEQHLHIEGTLEPSLLFSLAAKNNISLPSNDVDPVYQTTQTLLARYQRFTSLDDFLHYYYLGMSVLITADDFETLAWQYFTKAAGQNVRHAEVFFDPQAHISRGVPYDVVVEGLLAAKKRARDELALTVEYIVCILRHLPLPDSEALVDTVLSRGHFADGTLAGFGMVSSEKDFPPHLFREIYARVGATGTRLTSHVGEEVGPEFVREALAQLNVERVDHGLASARDADLLKQLAASETLLTFCPWSNVVLCNLPRLEDAPVRVFLDARVRFSLNSDDPAYFGAYIQDVFCKVQDTFDLSVADWEWIVGGAIEASWCGQDRKLALRTELDAVLASFAAA